MCRAAQHLRGHWETEAVADTKDRQVQAALPPYQWSQSYQQKYTLHQGGEGVGSANQDIHTMEIQGHQVGVVRL